MYYFLSAIYILCSLIWKIIPGLNRGLPKSNGLVERFNRTLL